MSMMAEAAGRADDGAEFEGGTELGVGVPALNVLHFPAASTCLLQPPPTAARQRLIGAGAARTQAAAALSVWHRKCACTHLESVQAYVRVCFE